MKLQPELDRVVEKFKQIRNLEDYAENLKKSGDYNDFETRFTPSKTICAWYKKYNCNDNHITTLAKTALKIARGGT